MDLTGIDPERIPRHVAVVMDGNGRWATQRGLKRTDGHAAGEDALFDTLDGAIDLGIDWFTVYAFSTENWKRPTDEVRYLMNYNKGILERHAEDLNSRNVRIRFIGRRDWRVPRGVSRRVDWATDLTKDNTGLTFTVAFNYGGRAEIVDAVYTIEIVPELAEQAQRRLDGLGYDNVVVREGDGYYGWKEHGPFDAIIVTAAASHIPPPLLEQLKPGGRMVIPVGAPFQVQRLMLVEKDDEGKVTQRSVMSVRFVPFTRAGDARSPADD